MTKDKGKIFTTWSILKEAYLIMKPRLWHIVGRFALFAIIAGATNVVVNKISILEFVFSVIFSFCLIVFAFTYTYKREDFTLDLVLKKITNRKFLVFVSAYILSTLAIFLGSILFILYFIFNAENPSVLAAPLAFPGMYVAVLLYFVKYIVYDKNVKPIEALKESVRMTKGHRFALIEYILVAVIVNLLGLLALVVGVFFTIPLTVIGTTLIYKKLSNRHKENLPSEVEVVEAEIVEPA